MLPSTPDEARAAGDLQLTAVAAGLQPVYDALDTLVVQEGEVVGRGCHLSGTRRESWGWFGDLWKVSRGDLDLESVVRFQRVFTAPLEGELSRRVWRRILPLKPARRGVRTAQTKAPDTVAARTGHPAAHEDAGMRSGVLARAATLPEVAARRCWRWTRAGCRCAG